MNGIKELKEWLAKPCSMDEVVGDAHEGYYLPVEKIRFKIGVIENGYNAIVNYSNFSFSLFQRLDKETFATAGIEIEIIVDGVLFKRLVGAYSWNIRDYDNERSKNEQYAGTGKTLAIRNAFSNEYPQFGSLLNTQEIEKSVQGKKPTVKTDAIKNTINNALSKSLNNG